MRGEEYRAPVSPFKFRASQRVQSARSYGAVLSLQNGKWLGAWLSLSRRIHAPQESSTDATTLAGVASQNDRMPGLDHHDGSSESCESKLQMATAFDGSGPRGRHPHPTDRALGAGPVDDRRRPILKTLAHFVSEGLVCSVRITHPRPGDGRSAAELITTTLLGIVVAAGGVFLLLL